MIARNIEHRSVHLCEARERLAHEVDGFCGRHAAIIDVPCDDDGICLRFSCKRKKLFEHVALVFRHIALPEELSKMPVGGVKKTHGFLLAERR